jgi:hypothetical protein
LVISTILEDLVIWVFPLSNLAILAVQRTSTAIVYAGFSVVLYSRLHLITRNLTLLRAIIWTIIATAILCNLPNILNMCIPSLLRNPLVYKITYGSQVVFALQEVMLSSLYIYLYYKFVRGGSFEPRDKMTFILLILAQIVILVSDVGMIVLIYVRLYLGRMALVPFTYAFKLRLEFVVLNRLAEPNNTARNLICGSQRSVPDPQVFDNPRDIGWKSWFGFLQWRRRELPTAQNLGGEKVDIATRAENTEQEAPGQRDCFSQITTHDISKIPYSCCVCRKMSFCSRATPESRADADSDSLDIEARYLGRFEAERMV